MLRGVVRARVPSSFEPGLTDYGGSTKDSLIAKLLQLEEETQATSRSGKTRYAQEIFRLHPAVRKRGGDQ